MVPLYNVFMGKSSLVAHSYTAQKLSLRRYSRNVFSITILALLCPENYFGFVFLFDFCGFSTILALLFPENYFGSVCLFEFCDFLTILALLCPENYFGFVCLFGFCGFSTILALLCPENYFGFVFLFCFCGLLHEGPDLKLFILVGWDRSFRLLLGPPGLN